MKVIDFGVMTLVCMTTCFEFWSILLDLINLYLDLGFEFYLNLISLVLDRKLINLSKNLFLMMKIHSEFMC